MNLTNTTGTVQYFPSVENRILVYEKDGSSLKPIKIYYDSFGRKWVEARDRAKFVIEVKNNNYDTYLAVVSVDGLNVIDASRAELKPKNGYVLSSKESLKIKGWRTSLKEVREFIFTFNKQDAYSTKLGAEDTNMGVIGLAFFKEKPVINNWSWGGTSSGWPPSNPFIYNTNATSSMPTGSYSTTGTIMPTSFSASIGSASAGDSGVLYDKVVTRSFAAGTAQGSAQSDAAIEVHKEFIETPDFVDAIYYDTRENLIANGILKETLDKLPEPFANTAFCPVV